MYIYIYIYIYRHIYMYYILHYYTSLKKGFEQNETMNGHTDKCVTYNDQR